jgi:protein-L-isoaspartate(D-aspartate) O-methyltransferase
MRQAGIREMLRVIESEFAYAAPIIGRKALDERVMAAMEKVPRDEFVPAALKSAAFADNALPIGDGQTISQPFIVALMTDLLEPEEDDVVLEVGTGSGYQAAILSTLVKKVYSIEVLPDLAHKAAERLRRLGYENVETRTGNGYLGLPEHAPFDGIMVTAAASHLPPPLIEQLKPGGRMVIPIGLPYMPQELMVVEKDEEGETRTRSVLGVAFVPLTGGRGDGREE